MFPAGQGTTIEQGVHRVSFCGSSRKRCSGRPMIVRLAKTAGAQVYDLLVYPLFMTSPFTTASVKRCPSHEVSHLPSGTLDSAPCVLLAASSCTWWPVASAL